MRILFQSAALGAALLMLWLGGARMHSKQLPEETISSVRMVQTMPAVTEPTVTGEPETLPPLQLTDLIAVEDMDAEHIFLYDAGKQEMVFCSTPETETLYPASITKLFSAWVALQILPEDQIITAGWELGLLQPGSSAAFIALDSRLSVQMLIEGMLLPSGNDAALVLAAAAGRHLLGEKTAPASQAVAEFVAEMNRAAQALGFANSHFENPDGYHAPTHHSCPADLARIAWLALDEPAIARCMALQQDRVTFVSGETHIWENTNRLINPSSPYYSTEAVGMKTGYTASAGYCLLAAFGEEPLVVGLFGGKNATSRYENARLLYDAWSVLSE